MNTAQEMKCPSCDSLTRAKHMDMHLDGNDYLYVCTCGNTWTNFVRRAVKALSTAMLAIMLCTQAFAQDGMATYYTTKSCQAEGTSGVRTANGERFDEHALTCALRRRDFGKHYLVYAHETGKSIIVRHNDFGPGEQSYYEHGNIIDLTPEGMRQLGIKGRGPVSVQEVIE